jgi:hypothetical protein
LLHLAYGFIGGQLVDGEGLSADQLPFGWGTVVVVGAVGGQIPVPPLTGFGETPTLAEGVSPLRAMVQLVAQASLQEVGSNVCSLSGDLGSDEVSVDVE